MAIGRARDQGRAGMRGSARAHTFSSAACVHAVESSDDDGSRSPRRLAAGTQHGKKKASNKEIKKRVRNILLPLKQKWRSAFRSRSDEAMANDDDGGGGAGEEQSDTETFVSAKSSELRSLCTDDDCSELPSFRLSPLIFPVGTVERPPAAAASPVKIVRKLPFGYVIGRPVDGPVPPSMALGRNLNKIRPLLSRSSMIKKKVVRALKERFGVGRGRRAGDGGCSDSGGGDGSSDGDGDDADVFWKKDVRGMRCRRVEEEEPPY